MKFTLHILLIAFLVALAFAASEQKAIIVSYPNNTPESVMEKAMSAIKEAGGDITHVYNSLIKGFSATAPSKVVDTVKAMVADHDGAQVEEDQVVSINGGGA